MNPVVPALLLSALLTVVLVLSLLSVLLAVVLILSMLLLGLLLTVALVLPLLLLGVLLAVVLTLSLLLLSVLCLPLLVLLRLLRVLLPLLRRMVLLVALVLILLSVSRTRDSEEQRQNRGADDSNCFHVLSPLPLISVACFYCRLPVVAFTGLPMASPDTRSSTLRFCCRPAALSLVATGRVSPNPVAVTEPEATPCCTR